MLVIACLAIVVIGPKQLPGALKTLGYWVGKARRLAREFQGHVDDMIAEAELDTVRDEVNSIANFDIEGELNRPADGADPTGTSDGAFREPLDDEALADAEAHGGLDLAEDLSEVHPPSEDEAEEVQSGVTGDDPEQAPFTGIPMSEPAPDALPPENTNDPGDAGEIGDAEAADDGAVLPEKQKAGA